MATPELPSFDLVVATIGRVAELDRLLGSLERQTHRRFTVLVVDQNQDDRLRPVLAAHPDLTIAHLRSQPGLSRARNAALGRLAADLVAFPDDDCEYPDDLLERVARRFDASPELGGLTGRTASSDGRSPPSASADAAVLTRGNLWNRGLSAALFLRRDVVQRVGAFDERLGLGSGERWSSGEETDYVVRALDAGVRVEYDPSLVVAHEVREDDRVSGLRSGASVGYLLRKHRYAPPVLARMLVRPVGGVVVSLARRDGTRAGFHAATLRGRVAGYLGASSSKSAR